MLIFVDAADCFDVKMDHFSQDATNLKIHSTWLEPAFSDSTFLFWCAATMFIDFAEVFEVKFVNPFARIAHQAWQQTHVNP